MMKKLVQLLVVLSVIMLSASFAFARSEKSTVHENADIAQVHRIAIGKPLYTPNPAEENLPTNDDVTGLLFTASKVARSYVLSYDTIAQSIKSDKKIDIKTLDRKKAAEIFKENVGNYADAYVILTIAGNSRKNFFFDVYKAGTNEFLFTYQLEANRSDKNDITTYTTFAEQFYKRFEKSAEDQQKAAKKKK